MGPTEIQVQSDERGRDCDTEFMCSECWEWTNSCEPCCPSQTPCDGNKCGQS